MEVHERKKGVNSYWVPIISAMTHKFLHPLVLLLSYAISVEQRVKSTT